MCSPGVRHGSLLAQHALQVASHGQQAEAGIRRAIRASQMAHQDGLAASLKDGLNCREGRPNACIVGYHQAL